MADNDPLPLPSRPNLIAALLVVILTGLAWFNRFVQDDAFISFRYADHLASGWGLVWNEGYRVEGYTNFLWTVLMAIPHVWHRDPVTFSHVLGLALFVGSLLLLYDLAGLVLPTTSDALLALVLLGTNYSFSCFATGGLETQLDAALFLASVDLLTRAATRRAWTHGACVGISLLLAVAVLNRPDSLILVAVVLPAAALFVGRETRLSTGQKLARLGGLTTPLAAVVAAFAVWKLGYYGSLLPNSYHVKLGATVSYVRGLDYAWGFVRSYWLFPFPLLILWYAPGLLRGPDRRLLAPLGLTFAWIAYVVRAGGDFMEFRMLVPVLPFMFLLFAWVIAVKMPRRALRAAGAGLLLIGSLHHASTSSRVEGVDSIRFLADLLAPEGSDWIGIGKALGAALRDDRDVTIAVTAAGAIPYYSRLRTIDMLGLNDLWVARHGDVLSSRPGHQRIAPFDYLVTSGTHLIIGHPLLVPREAILSYEGSASELLGRLQSPIKSLDQLPNDARVVEIPVDAERKLVAVYLRVHPRIEELIREGVWRAQPLKPGGAE